MAPTWNKALVRIASTKDPSKLALPDRTLMWDDQCIVIYDAFAKAKYHFLVLPRIPFQLSVDHVNPKTHTSPPMLKASNGKLNLGTTASRTVPASHLLSISTLLASPYAAEVLGSIRETSHKVIEHIQQDMKKEYGTTWPIERAFHAVPSMEHLHLHVVSMDLVSDRLKHKKHYLSFHPTQGFALSLDLIENLVKEGKTALPMSPSHYESLLKKDLVSHHTEERFRFVPDLKAHLADYWHKEILAKEGLTVNKEDDGNPSQSSPKRKLSDPILPPPGKKINQVGEVPNPLYPSGDQVQNLLKDDDDEQDTEPTLSMKW